MMLLPCLTFVVVDIFRRILAVLVGITPMFTTRGEGGYFVDGCTLMSHIQKTCVALVTLPVNMLS